MRSLIVFLLTTAASPQVTALSPLATSDLLGLEQYAAQSRRAEIERVLLLRDGKNPHELTEPKVSSVKTKRAKNHVSAGGGGFGGSQTARWSKTKSLVGLQKKRLLEDGVLRINGALSEQACGTLRAHVLEEREQTEQLYEASLREDTGFIVENHYGIEPTRKSRADLLLSLQPSPVTAALGELFNSSSGKLRHLYESLVTRDGILYELASVVTSSGSERQCVHPDVPFQATSPLYVVFAALQDVTTTMGPTTFLLGSNTLNGRKAYDNQDELDELLRVTEARESTMKTGDLVIFDARTLHCGNANLGGVHGGPDRALFNFSFRNPEITGPMGYKGSMRPAYTSAEIRLGDVLDAVDKLSIEDSGKISSVPPIFTHYGDGW
jgi:hypothetical protein